MAGKNLRTGCNKGSVVRYKNCTMGLNGSGFTQLIKARIRINQYITDRMMSATFAIAIKKLLKTNISSVLLWMELEFQHTINRFSFQTLSPDRG